MTTFTLLHYHTFLEFVEQDKVKEEEEEIIIEEEEQKPALSPEEEERSMRRAESSMGVSFYQYVHNMLRAIRIIILGCENLIQDLWLLKLHERHGNKIQNAVYFLSPALHSLQVKLVVRMTQQFAWQQEQKRKTTALASEQISDGLSLAAAQLEKLC